jgi:hypothetical protein
MKNILKNKKNIICVIINLKKEIIVLLKNVLMVFEITLIYDWYLITSSDDSLIIILGIIFSKLTFSFITFSVVWL